MHIGQESALAAFAGQHAAQILDAIDAEARAAGIGGAPSAPFTLSYQAGGGETPPRLAEIFGHADNGQRIAELNGVRIGHTFSPGDAVRIPIREISPNTPADDAPRFVAEPGTGRIKLAEVRPTGALPRDPTRVMHLACIGVGPKALQWLERLHAVALSNALPCKLVVHLFDPGAGGEGVHKMHQPKDQLTNTVAARITAFADPTVVDAGPILRGPTMLEWMQANGFVVNDDGTLTNCSYAGRPPAGRPLDTADYSPRALLGEYLKAACRAVEESFEANTSVEVVFHRSTAVDVAQNEDGRFAIEHRPADYLALGFRKMAEMDEADAADLRACFPEVPEGPTPFAQWVQQEFGGPDGSGPAPVETDFIVFATGHPHSYTMTEGEQALLDRVTAAKTAHPRAAFVPSPYPVGIQLSDAVIKPQSTVAIRGTGLTTHDVISALTVGRGGRFVETDGGLQYLRSGDEPARIMAYSRSGLWFNARGANQKGAEGQYRGVFFTNALVDHLRAMNQRTHGTRQLDFFRDLFPYLFLEMCRAYDESAARASGTAIDAPATYMPSAAAQAAISRLLALSYEQDGFANQSAYAAAMLDHIEEDLVHAGIGNVDDPVKAASDALRDVRDTVRYAVNQRGLTPQSHERFLSLVAPAMNRIASGPPLSRVRELIALLDAGLLTFAPGPSPRCEFDTKTGQFIFRSTQLGVPAETRADVLVQAQIQDFDPKLSPFYGQLWDRGLIRTPRTGELVLSGIDVTPTHNVVDIHGRPIPRAFALGTTTEGLNFYQNVLGHPGIGSTSITAAGETVLRIVSDVAEHTGGAYAVRAPYALGQTAIGETVLQNAAALAKLMWGKRLHAAYALGSLAHGGFSPHVSDVDLGLVLEGELTPDDAEKAALLTQTIRASGVPLGERLSVFWDSVQNLARPADAEPPGDAIAGRFPPLDRLDLQLDGRLLHGTDDVRARLPRPSHRELVAEGAAFALQKLGTPETLARLGDPAATAALDVRTLTKMLLFPVRFIYTAETNEVGMNEHAVEHYLGRSTGPAADLARAAFDWRHAPPQPGDPATERLIAEGIVPLYLDFVRTYERTLTTFGEHDLAREFRAWRMQLEALSSPGHA